jgi:hypothetical protein
MAGQEGYSAHIASSNGGRQDIKFKQQKFLGRQIILQISYFAKKFNIITIGAK